MKKFSQESHFNELNAARSPKIMQMQCKCISSDAVGLISCLVHGSLLTGSDRSLHQTSLETLQQSFLHIESSRATRYRYDHLGLVQLPSVCDEFPRVLHGRIVWYRRS